MLPFTGLLRALSLFVIASSIIFCLALYRRDLGHLAAQKLPLFDTLFPDDLDDRATFVQSVLDHEIDGSFDPTPIRNVCAEKTWNKDLVFVCGAPQGGIGNVRNVYLTCLRYAIEAGAAFVVPKLVARDTNDVSLLTTKNIVPFEHFFDLAHFTAALKSACPQMKLHSTPPVNITLHPPIHLQPQALVTEVYANTVIKHPEKWRSAFDTWLSAHPTTPSTPSIIELDTPLLNYPVNSDPPTFASSFGRLLRLREPCRRLSASILFNLRSTYNIPITPLGISPSAFFGAHLRVAADATKAGWTDYKTQAAFLLDYAHEVALQTIYVTSESNVTETLRADAKARGAVVFAKEDLLDAAEVKELHAMTWDQQALVDFEVLLRSSAFGGIELSSFAWNVALRRHVISKEGEEAWDAVETSSGMNMKDEYSRLIGNKNGYPLFREAMWP